jgi:hypothetical protein
MKNSVNNKSFDEIFAQRGEQVQPDQIDLLNSYRK